MRVIGSTTTFVLAIVILRVDCGLWHLLCRSATPDLREHRRRRMRRYACCRTDCERGTDRVRPLLDREAADIRQPSVERRHRVPEMRFGASDARATSANRPARARVPLEDRARRESLRSLASHLIETESLAG